MVAWKIASSAGGSKEGDVGAGEVEEVREVGGELVAGESGQVASDDDALGEGLVHGQGQASAQLRVADEEEGQAVLRVHVVVGQEPQVFEDLGAEVLGLVDDQDGLGLGLDAQAGDFEAAGAEERGAAALDRRGAGR